MAHFELRRALKKSAFILSGYDKVRRINHNGADFDVRCSDHIGKRLLLNGGYENTELEYLIERCNKQAFDIFLDIGACFGLYSMTIARNSNIPEFHAIEPSSTNNALLRHNITINELENRVTTHQLAISDYEGKAELFRPFRQNMGGSVLNPGSEVVNRETADEKEVVDATTIDRLFEWTDKKILVKMDVDFHEEQVLKGARGLFLNNAIFLQVEVLPDALEKVAALLDSYNMRFVYNHDKNYYFESRPK